MHIARIMKRLSLLLMMTLPSQILGADVSITVLDKQGKPLEDIVVYITGENLMNDYQPQEVAIYQEDKKFTPYITVKTPQDA